MIKKVYILNPSDAPSTERQQIRCSVCKTLEKSNLNACESEHVVCKSCQSCDDSMRPSSEGGDYISDKEFDPDSDVPPLHVKKSAVRFIDLAGGDRNIWIAPLEINEDVNKWCKEDEKSLINKKLTPKQNFEITMEYKNPNFQESKSSINTDACSIIFDNKEEDEAETADVIDPRPVVCPVTECSKIVTIDSFLLHFLFDHSKVPRTTLDDTAPQEVTLKAANFSTELQCVATFIIEAQKRPIQTMKTKLESVPSSRNSKRDNKLLLLMAVRLPTSSVKLPNVKCDPSAVFSRSIHTQTEKLNEHYLEINSEPLNKSGGSDYKSCTSRTSVLEEDEVFLLWLCKLDDAERVFSITLLGEDKRQGYCYIGDAVHVRDKQDPSLLYDRSDCLIVKGSAVNRIFDPQGQITAIVSLIG